MPDRLLTEPEAARRLGWSAVNLRARRRKRDADPKSDAAPVYVRIGSAGGSVRYPSREIARWLKRHPEYAKRGEQFRKTISQHEVCALLNMGHSTLRRCRARLAAEPKSDAAPRHVRVGQAIRYRKSDVTAWIRRQAQGAGAGG